MKNRSLMLLALMSLSFVSCKKEIIKIEGKDVAIYEAASGKRDAKNLEVNYNQDNDSVTFSGKIKDTGSSIVKYPLNINGLRVHMEKSSDSVKICSALGFRNTSYPEFDYRDTTAFIGVYSDTQAKYRSYPAFHMSGIENPVIDSNLDFIPDVSSFAFGEGSRYKNNRYLTSITCFGTTNAHFNDQQEFSSDNFLENYINKSLVSDIRKGSNVYTQSANFLVSKSVGTWTSEGDIDTSNDFSDTAKAGAEDICKKSGYAGLLIYTIKYREKSQVGDNVYVFNRSTSNWTIDQTPEDDKIRYDAEIYNIQETEYLENLPSVYLDDIYCYQ